MFVHIKDNKDIKDKITIKLQDQIKIDSVNDMPQKFFPVIHLE